MRSFILISLFTLVMLSGFSQSCKLDTLLYKGVNYQRELHFVSPVVPGRGFSIQNVFVNGEATFDELQTNTVTVHLERTPAKLRDSVFIMVLYVKGYKPYLINPENLLPPNDFEFSYVRVRDNKIMWRTRGALGYKPFRIEEYRWERWIEVGQVYVFDSLKWGSYEFELKPHYGKNQYRVIKVNGQGETVISKDRSFRSYSLQKPEILDDKVEDVLVFSVVTMYEIYDRDWKLLKKGRDRYVNVSDLPKGKYNINYGNTSGTFKKR